VERVNHCNYVVMYGDIAGGTLFLRGCADGFWGGFRYCLGRVG
jgi:hypothetical protein